MQNIQNELTIPQRLAAPTPKLFAKIRNAGIILAAISGALLTIEAQGITLPPYLDIVGNVATTVASLIASVVSQLTVNVQDYQIKQALK